MSTNPVLIDAHRCPICDRRFESKRALFSHVAYTQVHDTILEELWKNRFLLAEAEREKEIYRQQRDEWRAKAKDWEREYSTIQGEASYARDARRRLLTVESEKKELAEGLCIAINAGRSLAEQGRRLIQENTQLRLDALGHGGIDEQ